VAQGPPPRLTELFISLVALCPIAPQLDLGKSCALDGRAMAAWEVGPMPRWLAVVLVGWKRGPVRGVENMLKACGVWVPNERTTTRVRIQPACCATAAPRKQGNQIPSRYSLPTRTQGTDVRHLRSWQAYGRPEQAEVAVLDGNRWSLIFPIIPLPLLHRFQCWYDDTPVGPYLLIFCFLQCGLI